MGIAVLSRGHSYGVAAPISVRVVSLRVGSVWTVHPLALVEVELHRLKPDGNTGIEPPC